MPDVSLDPRFDRAEVERVAHVLSLIHEKYGRNPDRAARYINQVGTQHYPDESWQPGYVEVAGFCITHYKVDGAERMGFKVTISAYTVESFLERWLVS
jgi:hypothetical protein